MKFCGVSYLQAESSLPPAAEVIDVPSTSIVLYWPSPGGPWYPYESPMLIVIESVGALRLSGLAKPMLKLSPAVSSAPNRKLTVLLVGSVGSFMTTARISPVTVSVFSGSAALNLTNPGGAASTTGATIVVTLVQTLLTPKFPSTLSAGVKERETPFKVTVPLSMV